MFTNKEHTMTRNDNDNARNATRTIDLPDGDAMTYDLARQVDFDAAVAAYDPDGIAACFMPASAYLDDSRRQAWFCGWAAAAMR